jgi:hypothetical protein
MHENDGGLSRPAVLGDGAQRRGQAREDEGGDEDRRSQESTPGLEGYLSEGTGHQSVLFRAKDGSGGRSAPRPMPEPESESSASSPTRV